ncbi:MULTISPECIES: D-ribose pyranase [Actinoalloteichus]|uniref:D-ribose pyranase n=1 Tax=Actinoalloteichus fjordicus TaxID=1612552 RepID=A0AAC9PVG2_9PSEU|nr:MULTISPECIES: D-ribose pyranase [Actinoalloteichus]APU18020.1 ABC-type ribose transport system, auxiliary component [Actinoalloteichus fjordicus]APU24099.1 ABC-type ribose transport system, auxiliary component [Actinoalloteichus sp. GBA129-24]
MKRDGILHAGLSGALARLGHTDRVVVADCGLPIPDGPELIDLAFRFGVPSFLEVVDGLLAEAVFESALVAGEMDSGNPMIAKALIERLGEPERVQHEEFKSLVADSRLVIRTGEATPYANVILRCGVPF